MAIISLLLVVLILLALVGGIIILTLKKDASGVKIMLLGISITIFGEIIAVDSNSSLEGIEYLISFIGVIISIVGFVKRD